jgi:hypothetical protein
MFRIVDYMNLVYRLVLKNGNKYIKHLRFGTGYVLFLRLKVRLEPRILARLNEARVNVAKRNTWEVPQVSRRISSKDALLRGR